MAWMSWGNARAPIAGRVASRTPARVAAPAVHSSAHVAALPQPSAVAPHAAAPPPAAGIPEAPAPVLTAAPPAVTALRNGCPQYWNQVRYKTYRVANPVAGGGSFAVDMETIKTGYYWIALYAAAHMGTASQIPVAFALLQESDRSSVPAQSASAPQSAGIVLGGPLGAVRPDLTVWNAFDFMPIQCPVYPLYIPNGFFLRAFNFGINNIPAQGITMEMRIAFLELPVDDPGPSGLSL